jgi:hypothetical protein
MRTEIADKRWAKKYPNIATGPVLAEPCASPEYFELEREMYKQPRLPLGFDPARFVPVE